MSLHLSNSLPSLRLTFPDGDINEYRARQGCVEFRANHGVWRLLDECEVQFHLALRTEVAKWLKRQSANGNAIAAQGNR
jgi:hypothetical protein